MTFRGILFSDPQDEAASQTAGEPDCFPDLYLAQVLSSLTEGREEYGLEPYFRYRLPTVDAIVYRQEVFRDLGRPGIRAALSSFAARMRETRSRLRTASQLRHPYQRSAVFREAAGIYHTALVQLDTALQGSAPASRALLRLSEWLTGHVRSTEFAAFSSDLARTAALFDSVHYTLTIGPGQVTVAPCHDEEDMGAAVMADFARFSQGTPPTRLDRPREFHTADTVEAAVLDRVALLFPAPFAQLAAFADTHRDFLDATISTVDREAQFYLACLDLTDRFHDAGLPTCLPEVSVHSKRVLARETYDMALAERLIDDSREIVVGDFHLAGHERMLVVTGPNQGGKTTLARTFGQLHHFAALGAPVAGRKALLPLCDVILTHFERGEQSDDTGGQLRDDLIRVHQLLSRATSSSIVILNELFTSTTSQDAILLGRRVLTELTRRGTLGVFVTFVHELASLNEATVSMVSTVDPENPTRRTYRLERRPADDVSYAESLARLHRLTFRGITQRLSARAHATGTPEETP
ncbi:DNA mismatch repair protein MutS [Streptomyces sp. GZWMJZ-114]|uniref:MutS-related protein n=1 Tax=Streptomyces sp. GZWMJZ-114 TaxID=2494734 RepID=UPI001013300D|nr:DNA mismatch repair protein MutS [Streptomyces sp. GZWMJZ-114]